MYISVCVYIYIYIYILIYLFIYSCMALIYSYVTYYSSQSVDLSIHARSYFRQGCQERQHPCHRVPAFDAMPRRPGAPRAGGCGDALPPRPALSALPEWSTIKPENPIGRLVSPAKTSNQAIFFLNFDDAETFFVPSKYCNKSL